MKYYILLNFKVHSEVGVRKAPPTNLVEFQVRVSGTGRRVGGQCTHLRSHAHCTNARTSGQCVRGGVSCALAHSSCKCKNFAYPLAPQDLFLVGFFLSAGAAGPTPSVLGIGVFMGLFLPLKGLL